MFVSKLQQPDYARLKMAYNGNVGGGAIIMRALAL